MKTYGELWKRQGDEDKHHGKLQVCWTTCPRCRCYRRGVVFPMDGLINVHSTVNVFLCDECIKDGLATSIADMIRSEGLKKK